MVKPLSAVVGIKLSSYGIYLLDNKFVIFLKIQNEFCRLPSAQIVKLLPALVGIILSKFGDRLNNLFTWLATEQQS